MKNKTFLFFLTLILIASWLWQRKVQGPKSDPHATRPEFQHKDSPVQNKESKPSQSIPVQADNVVLTPPSKPSLTKKAETPEELETKKCLTQWGDWQTVTPQIQKALRESKALPELNNFEFETAIASGAQRMQVRREDRGRYSAQFFSLDSEGLPIPLGDRQFFDHFPQSWLDETLRNQPLKHQERSYILANKDREIHLTLLSKDRSSLSNYQILDLEMIQEGKVLSCSLKPDADSGNNPWNCTCRQ